MDERAVDGWMEIEGGGCDGGEMEGSESEVGGGSDIHCSVGGVGVGVGVGVGFGRLIDDVVSVSGNHSSNLWGWWSARAVEVRAVER